VLVVLTGYALDVTEGRCREAGFDHYLLKPTDPKALERLLAGLAQQ
jgi:CheY-like chemotaxis protein